MAFGPARATPPGLAGPWRCAPAEGPARWAEGGAGWRPRRGRRGPGKLRSGRSRAARRPGEERLVLPRRPAAREGAVRVEVKWPRNRETPSARPAPAQRSGSPWEL